MRAAHIEQKGALARPQVSESDPAPRRRRLWVVFPGGLSSPIVGHERPVIRFNVSKLGAAVSGP